MKLWVHASILKSALLANAADKKTDDDTTKRPLKTLDSTCSNKSSVSLEGLSTRKEQWVWVLSEVIAGSTQDLFATTDSHNALTSPKRNNTKTAASTTADATLTIRVLDPESDYADKVIEIAREHINMVDGGRGVLPANTFEENQPLPSDLTQLTHLHEPAVLDCLHRRYQLPSGWEMYTSSGPILIAINPCRIVKALYDESTMKLYQRHGELLANGGSSAPNNNNNHDKVSSSSPPPHVFAVADSAYRGMIRGLDFARNKNSIEEKKESSALSNQSILVSGESGAGKTVTTKFLMQYLADLSRKVHSDHAATGNDDKSSIEQRVLNSNPILEAFGNARTLRNDNSSRFGKFIEMRFSDRGRLLGAYIDTYLLEKARIVGHTCGEQTYHIFYEVLAKGSLTEAMRRQLMIENTSTADFVITTSDGGENNSKLCHSEFDDHCKMFLELRSAMGTLSFSQNEQMEIFQVVCALLHLSNLTLNDAFVDVNDGEECKLNENNLSLKRALSLLGVSYEALDSAVTTVQFKAVDELVTKNLSTSQAAQAVQALIKGVYDSIFTILVGRINSCIAGASSSVDTENDSGGAGAFIGLLDIFGFETFQKNAFEQFCINYCNESLQQQFNRFVFKLEQQEYIREGIRWDMIEFQDNQDTLDLIEKKHAGILTILDEQCRLGMRCNDKTFASAVYSKCMSGNTRFGANRKQQSHGKFTIRHYAGVVEYSTDGFMEKNKDEIPMEASELLSQSTCAFVRDIAQVISAKTGSQKESKSSISRVSVGKQFSGQLQKLRLRIDETHPHYVRCIKPNEQLQPNHFDSNIVVDQLRCGGILEAIRVSRAGFPQRYTFEHFVARFSVLSATLGDKRQATSKVGKINIGSNGISSKKKRASKTQANTKDECEALVKLISQWILKDKENDPEVEHQAEPEPDASSETTPPLSFWKNKSASNSSKNDLIDLSDAGIQVGATKVFLIQDTFDIIERLRGQVTVSNATKISSIVRMYLARKAFIVMLQDRRQARAQRRLLFEANPFNTQTKKYRAIDENLVGKVDANVEGFEIVANGEREASTNPEPTDFVWHSIGHGRFVKKGEAGYVDIPPGMSAECRTLEQFPVETSFHDHIDQEKREISTPSTSTSMEQQSKPDSSVSRLVLTLEEKKGTVIAPVSPMSFWSSQSSPRASSGGNLIESETQTTAASNTNKVNTNGIWPQSIKADGKLALTKNPDTNQARSFWSSQSSPRASSGGKVIESETQTTASSNTNKVNTNGIWSQSVKADANLPIKKNPDTNQARSLWSSQSSPRASSGGKVIESETQTTASSNTNKINTSVIRPQSVKADGNLPIKKNMDINTSRLVRGSQSSPRASSDENVIESLRQTTAASNADEIKRNVFRPQSIKADANSTIKKNTDINTSRLVRGSQSSPRSSSDGNTIETKNKATAVSSADKIKSNIFRPQSIKDDTSSVKKNNANVPSMRVPTNNNIIRHVPSSSDGRVNSSASSTVKSNTQIVREAQHMSEVRPSPKADATSGIKSTSNEPSSPHSFNAFPVWQEPASVQLERKTPSQLAPQTNFSNHFGSNVTVRQKGKVTTEHSREKRQDSSTQHSFSAFSESSFAPKTQFNTFQKAISPRTEEQHSPASSSNHSGHQNVSVAARRRAKAMNAATMIDNMSSSYKQMQPKPVQTPTKPVQTPTKPIAPVIAPPPPLSSSAKARRNMKQKMQRNNSRTASASVSGSHSGSFSDFADF